MKDLTEGIVNPIKNRINNPARIFNGKNNDEIIIVRIKNGDITCMKNSTGNIRKPNKL
jgi:hypothetical protein